MRDNSYTVGMKTRRQILGDGHVDRAIALTCNVNEDFQDLIVRYGWGEVWSRPALGYRERRILVMGTMIALGCWEELKLHMHAALAADMPLSDIKELILQQAVYCGIPAANAAHTHLASVLAERKAS